MINSTDRSLYEKSKKEDTLIKILGAPNNTTPGEEVEMEEVDGNSVETFTLEEFRVLILECRKRNIDFIIARVTTPDPYDQTTLYNFYYAASELNRVLFRFESERRLLHRMKVRNPLNNMYILGQVYYYKITPEEIDKSIVSYYFNGDREKKNKSKMKAFSAEFKTAATQTAETIDKSKDADNSIVSTSYIDESDNDTQVKETIENYNEGLISTGNVSETKKIVYNATFFGTDDDFLMQSSIRDYFRRNSLDENDEFLFEIDRGQNDFFALLESGDEEENEEIVSWKRIFSAHISVLFILVGVCLLIGTGPLILLIAIPFALFFFLSFIGSIFYVLFCRRNTFDTLAVQSVEQV